VKVALAAESMRQTLQQPQFAFAAFWYRHYPGRSAGTRSLVLSHQRRPSRLHGGLAPALIVSRPAQRRVLLRR
jgi:hypothetical protein